MRRAVTDRTQRRQFAAIPLRALTDQRNNGAHLRVLAAISSFDRFGDNGRGCDASHPEIAKIAGVTRETVARKAADLVSWGYLEMSKPNGRTGRAQYRVIHDLVTSRSLDTAPTSDQPITRYSSTSDQQITKTSDRPVTHKTRVKTGQKRHSARSGAKAKPSLSEPSSPPCPHQQIIDLYHEILPSNPGVKVWNEERQRWLRSRWREERKRQTLAYWRGFFTFIATECPFLTGQVEGRNGVFLPGLDWMVRPRNFANIIEGKYADRQPGPSPPARESAAARTVRQAREYLQANGLINGGEQQ